MQQQQSRFILFIGNLPYDVSKEQLRAHFRSAEPISSVRLLTDKMTKRPKGFAFLEFASADAFQRGLAYHHSLLNNRKINVEMTAGGGGSKSNVRKQKLIKKNEQLQKQRQQIHTNRISTQNLQDQQESKGIKSESIAPDIARPRKRVTGANAITI